MVGVRPQAVVGGMQGHAPCEAFLSLKNGKSHDGQILVSYYLCRKVEVNLFSLLSLIFLQASRNPTVLLTPS